MSSRGKIEGEKEGEAGETMENKTIKKQQDEEENKGVKKSS